MSEKMFHALVTRPEEDATRTREKLEARGVRVSVAPMLNIVPIMGAKPQLMAALSHGPQAVLITSANGLRVLAEATDERDVPVFAVGESSAEEARNLGFQNVTSADGDAKALAQKVQEECVPEKEFLLHVAGNVQAGDLKGNLESSGFEVQRIVAYEAEAVMSIPTELKACLVNCEIDLVLCYSRRTLGIFEALLKEGRLEYLVSHITLFCLSPESTPELSWKHIHIAEKPSEEALLALIDGQLLDKIAAE